MKLVDYRNLKEISVSDAAKNLCVSDTCFRFWENGIKIPLKENMAKIFSWSDGNVQPNDFYDLPNLQFPARGFASVHDADEDRNSACGTQTHEKSRCSCSPFSFPLALNDYFGVRSSSAEVSS